MSSVVLDNHTEKLLTVFVRADSLKRHLDNGCDEMPR